ncbi:hypothetical protein DES39_1033 [Orbus hercynius]|uniref:Uncharacterized protein n=1 Tax=Orbus hercynius TaxID=593135 RepID=A0A495RKA8_9GAMM|nr:hypothetical protein [Orbus hercynius]RKS87789.1 hypothetical protein DES39_1033 [Orbus hercynius]
MMTIIVFYNTIVSITEFNGIFFAFLVKIIENNRAFFVKPVLG